LHVLYVVPFEGWWEAWKIKAIEKDLEDTLLNKKREENFI